MRCAAGIWGQALTKRTAAQSRVQKLADLGVSSKACPQFPSSFLSSPMERDDRRVFR